MMAAKIRKRKSSLFICYSGFLLDTFSPRFSIQFPSVDSNFSKFVFLIASMIYQKVSAQIPFSWKPVLEEPSTLQIFFLITLPSQPPLSKEVVPNITMVETYSRLLLSIPHSLFHSHLRFVEGDGATVTAIHQCMRTGPLDRASYKISQKQIEITKAVTGGEANMTFAWHRTSRKGVKSILSHGFGMPCKIPGSELTALASTCLLCVHQI